MRKSKDLNVVNNSGNKFQNIAPRSSSFHKPVTNWSVSTCLIVSDVLDAMHIPKFWKRGKDDSAPLSHATEMPLSLKGSQKGLRGIDRKENFPEDNTLL